MSTDDTTTDAADSTTGPATAPQQGTTRRGSGLTAPILLVAALVVALDQITKQVALSTLARGEETRWFLGELLGWKLVHNPGAALSIGAGFTWILTIIAIAVAAFIIARASRITSKAWGLSLALVLGGALGNLIDRLARQPGFGEGHVVDFINYAGFFVGNVADIAIVVAACVMIVLAFRGIPMGLEGQDDAEATEGSGATEGFEATEDAEAGEPTDSTVSTDAGEGDGPTSRGAGSSSEDA